MAKDRDEETGKYTESFPLERFLSVLNSLSDGATTQEVADEIGCAYRTAHAKLSELEEVGQVKSRKVGNAKLWTVDKDE
jgi:predicted transcriptional regulator